MKLYTPGEKYVSLTTIIRTSLECMIIVGGLGGALWCIEHGHLVVGCVLAALDAVAMAVTIILAAMWVRQ